MTNPLQRFSRWLTGGACAVAVLAVAVPQAMPSCGPGPTIKNAYTYVREVVQEPLRNAHGYLIRLNVRSIQIRVTTTRDGVKTREADEMWSCDFDARWSQITPANDVVLRPVDGRWVTTGSQALYNKHCLSRGMGPAWGAVNARKWYPTALYGEQPMANDQTLNRCGVLIFITTGLDHSGRMMGRLQLPKDSRRWQDCWVHGMRSF